MTQPLKFVALYDIHVGKERAAVGGRMITRPTYNLPAINAVMKFATKHFRPDVWVLGGDQLNCGPVSHWNKGRPRLVEGFRLKDEYDKLDSLVIKPIEASGAARKIWLDGNHEVWIQQELNSNPALEGLVEPQNYLRLREKGWELHSQGEVAKVGKLNFVHGDVVLQRGGYANPAARLLQYYRRNIRAGHIHTLSAATEISAVDQKDFHTAIVVPSLSSRNPEFIKNSPNHFINGFLVGYVNKDGSFSDFPVIVNQGRFVWDGKVFDGN